MDELGNKLGFKMLDDWYKITRKTLVDIIDIKLFESYHNSTYNLLSNVYPHHDWNKWKFKPISWEDPNIRLQFFDWLSNKLGFKNLDNWYNVKQMDIILHGEKDFFENTKVLLL